MQIYTFQSSYNMTMNVIYALGAILFAAIAFALIRYFACQIKAYSKSNMKFPRILLAIFVVISFVPIVGSLLFGNVFIKSASYDYQMEKGNAYCLEGNIELISCEEEYYRDSFEGYTVVLSVEGVTIAPSNTFPSEVIKHFESDEKLIIKYGEIPNNDVYVWSIYIADDNVPTE